MNNRAVESLIRAGCFDDLGARRVQCMAVYESAMDAQANQRRQNVTGQVSFFDFGQSAEGMRAEETYPDLPEYPLRELLFQEKEMTGVYCSAHPLDEYAAQLQKLPVNTSVLAEYTEREDKGLSEDGRRVTMGGIITECHGKATRKGGMMGFLTLEDAFGQVECMLFPRVWERYSHQIAADQAVLITGRLSVRDDEDIKLLADVIEPLRADSQPKKDPRTDAQAAKDAKTKVYLRIVRDQMSAVQDALSAMKGEIPVYLHLPEEGITLLAPRSMWVQSAEAAQRALGPTLGDENIKIVTK